jgi:uncharacterized protein YbjT (DUF2867 family)
MTSHAVFVTGATGYIGRGLVATLLAKGFTIRALVRPGSESRLPPGCIQVTGDPLDRSTFADAIAPARTFVQLVGVPHPSPAKARQFRRVDLISARESVLAAGRAGIDHFVYVSVAQPSPMMRAYVETRITGEALIREAGFNATILRPLYVLGPGHHWPSVLRPAYWIAERIPATREGALRLGLVTLDQMIRTMVAAIESPPHGIRVLTVPDIRLGRPSAFFSGASARRV